MLSQIMYFQMDKRGENVVSQDIWPHFFCSTFNFIYLKRFLKIRKKKEKKALLTYSTHFFVSGKPDPVTLELVTEYLRSFLLLS